MIRMFSIGIGISTVRVLGPVLFLILPNASLEARIGISFWLGFGVNLATAEFCIRHTRQRCVSRKLATGVRDEITVT
jgi:hypothetical protein